MGRPDGPGRGGAPSGGPDSGEPLVAKLYLVADKDELDRRRKRLGPTLLVEFWQDLYTPDIAWIGPEEVRRIVYGQAREPAPAGLFWMGEESKAALDRVGPSLDVVLAVDEAAVPVYYGPHLADAESLPREETLRARVLSAHGIAAIWATYDRDGQRMEWRPASPTDPVFYLRRPRGHVVHLFRLLRTQPEASLYVAQHAADDPEAVAWANGLPFPDFDTLVAHFRQHG